MAFLDMLTGVQDQQQLQSPYPTSAETPYGQIQAGQPNVVETMNKPTTDPQEIDRRKQGWSEVAQRMLSDPNISRALTYFGASMGGRFGPGDTLAGRFAQSVAVGRSAYDQGLLAQEEQQGRAAKEARAQAESEAGVAHTQAQTGTLQAALPGVVARGRKDIAEADVAEATVEQAKARIGAELELTKTKLEGAKTENARQKILLDWDKRVADIKASIPNTKIQESLLAGFQKDIADLEKIRAQTKEANAQAGAAGAHAKYFTAEARKANAQAQGEEDINKLPVEERGRARARASGTQSATVQLNEQMRSVWKEANPKKADETDAAYNQRAAQAMQKFMTERKPADEMADFLKFQENFGKGGEKVEDALARYRDLRRAMGESTVGSGLPQPKTLAERNALPSGAKYLAPDGTVRTKP